jgi:hypothetical protein
METLATTARPHRLAWATIVPGFLTITYPTSYFDAVTGATIATGGAIRGVTATNTGAVDALLFFRNAIVFGAPWVRVPAGTTMAVDLEACTSATVVVGVGTLALTAGAVELIITLEAT